MAALWSGTGVGQCSCHAHLNCLCSCMTRMHLPAASGPGAGPVCALYLDFSIVVNQHGVLLYSDLDYTALLLLLLVEAIAIHG